MDSNVEQHFLFEASLDGQSFETAFDKMAKAGAKSLEVLNAELANSEKQIENLARAAERLTKNPGQGFAYLDTLGKRTPVGRDSVFNQYEQLNNKINELRSTIRSTQQEEAKLADIIEKAAKAQDDLLNGAIQTPQQIINAKVAITQLFNEIEAREKKLGQSPLLDDQLRRLRASQKIEASDLVDLTKLEQQHGEAIKKAVEQKLKEIELNRQILEQERALAGPRVRANIAASQQARASSNFDGDLTRQQEARVRQAIQTANQAEAAIRKIQKNTDASGDVSGLNKQLDVVRQIRVELEEEVNLLQRLGGASPTLLLKAQAVLASPTFALKNEKDANFNLKAPGSLTASLPDGTFVNGIPLQQFLESKQPTPLYEAQLIERQAQLDSKFKALKEPGIPKFQGRPLFFTDVPTFDAIRSGANIIQPTTAEDLQKRQTSIEAAFSIPKADRINLKAVKSDAELLDQEIGKITADFLKARNAAESLRKSSGGIATPEVKKAQETTDAYAASLRNALSQADALGSKTANMAKAQAALNKEFSVTPKQGGSLIQSLRDIGLAYFALQNALYTVRSAIDAVGHAFISTNVLMEQAKLSIAATFQNNYIESFDQSLQRADGFVKKLREEAVKTNLTFEELQQASSTALPALIARGANPDQALQVISVINQAAKLNLGEKYDPGRSLDEIRALLNKQITGRTNETIQALGISKADLKSVKDMNDLLDLLAKKSQGIVAANKVFQTTFLGAFDRAKDSVFRLSAELGKPLFDVATESLNQFNVALAEGKFDGFIQGIQEVVKGLAILLNAFTALALKMQEKVIGNVSLGELILRAGTAAVGGAALSGFGPGGIVVGAGIGAFAPEALRAGINHNRNISFQNDPSGFAKVASDEDLRALHLQESRNQETNENILNYSQDPSQVDQARKSYNQAISNQKIIEGEVSDRAKRRALQTSEGKRRFPALSLGNDKKTGKTPKVPTTLLEPLPGIREIEAAQRAFEKQIAAIDNETKLKVADLDNIQQGGLEVLQAELDSSIQKKEVTDNFLPVFEGHVNDKQSELAANKKKYEDIVARVKANPKDVQSAQQGRVLRSNITQQQSDVERGLNDLTKFRNDSATFGADIVKQQEALRVASRARKVLITDLQSSLKEFDATFSSDVISAVFEKGSAAAQRLQTDIENTKAEIDRLTKTINNTSVDGVILGPDGKPLQRKLSPEEQKQKDLNEAKLNQLKMSLEENNLKLEKQQDEFKQISQTASFDALSRQFNLTQASLSRLPSNKALTQKDIDAQTLISRFNQVSIIDKILSDKAITNPKTGDSIAINPEQEQQLLDFKSQFIQETQAIRKAYEVNIVEAGKTAFDSFFDSILQGTASVKQALIGLLQSIATQVERSLSTLAANRLIALFGGRGGPLLGAPSVASLALSNSPGGGNIFGGGNTAYGLIATTASQGAFHILHPQASLLPKGQILSSQQQAITQATEGDVIGQAGGSIAATAGTASLISKAPLILAKVAPALTAVAGGLYAVNQINNSRKQYGTNAGTIGGSLGGAAVGAVVGGVLASALTLGIGAGAGALIGAGIGAGGGAAIGAGSDAAISKKFADALTKSQTKLQNTFQGFASATTLTQLSAQEDALNASYRSQVASVSKTKGKGSSQANKAAQKQLKSQYDQYQAQLASIRAQLQAELDQLNNDLYYQIEDLKRVPGQRGVLPQLNQSVAQLSTMIQKGVDPQKVYELFNLQVEDLVRQAQTQLDAVNQQLQFGGEDKRGNLVSLQQKLQNDITDIQTQAQDQLDQLRQGYASQALAILNTGRASAINPSVLDRQTQLSALSAKQLKDETKLNTATSDSIAKDTAETNRQILDLNKQSNDLLAQIAQMLQDGINQGSTIPGFNYSYLQSIQSFLAEFNPLKSLQLAPALTGGIGINIGNLTVSPDITDAQLGATIRAEINKASQDAAYKRTALQ